MTSRLLGCTLLAACALATSAGLGQAQDNSLPFEPRLTHYRVLPRLSVLHQTGGFAGVDIRYRVRGDFDFEVTQSPLAVFPPIYSARFVDPELVGLHPVRDDLFDVDEALNLAKLEGGQTLRHPRWPNLFTFRGETGDGSSVQLHALRRGPWFYMRGGTTPPPGGADFFEFDIRLVARRAPLGDMNDDGVVDGKDLREWAADRAGRGDDFLEWQRQLGEKEPTMEELDGELNEALAATGASMAAVPEPTSLAMLLTAGASLAALARRRRGD